MEMIQKQKLVYSMITKRYISRACVDGKTYTTYILRRHMQCLCFERFHGRFEVPKQNRAKHGVREMLISFQAEDLGGNVNKRIASSECLVCTTMHLTYCTCDAVVYIVRVINRLHTTAAKTYPPCCARQTQITLFVPVPLSAKSYGRRELWSSVVTLFFFARQGAMNTALGLHPEK